MQLGGVFYEVALCVHRFGQLPSHLIHQRKLIGEMRQCRRLHQVDQVNEHHVEIDLVQRLLEQFT
ncbi:hypothetical protein D3C76_1590460 [compost metagenome]